MRPEPIDKLMQEIKCPLTAVFGELDNLIHRDNIVRMFTVLAGGKKSLTFVFMPTRRTVSNDTMPGRSPRSDRSRVATNHLFLKSVFAGEWKERAIWRCR
jgi:hypothetical protein